MTHADLKKNLASYLEGDLALDDRALVDAHLDECSECARHVDEMLQTINLLRSLPEPEHPPLIAANVMRRIRAGEGQSGFFSRLGSRLGAVLEPSFVLPASAVAAAALVVTVVQGPGGGPSTDGAAQIAQPPPASVASLPSPSSLSVSRAEAARTPLASSTSQSPGQASARIRIRIDGSGVSRMAVSRRMPPQRSSPPPQRLFTSEVPEAWADEFSRVMSGNRSAAGSGMFVSAERVGGIDDLGRSAPDSPTRSLDGGASRSLRDRASDPRDAWLTLGLEDPVEFSRYIAGRSLAEQELWATRLAERASARGIMDEFLRALRKSGDATAAWVADDIAAQADAYSGSAGFGVDAVDSMAQPQR